MIANAYQYFCAVEYFQNISKAASYLNITQPALTKSINRLEQELGIRLFDRTASPITLTPAGQKFSSKAHAILELEKSLFQDLESYSSSPHGVVTFGITTEACSSSLPYILPRLRQSYPRLQLKLAEGHNHFLLEELEKGKIDLALIASPPVVEDLETETVQIENIILAVPANHPIARSCDLSNNSPLTPYYLNPERIRHTDFIVCAPELGMGKYAQDLFRKYDLQPNIVLQTRRNETALRLASTGAGLAFTPVKTPLRVQLIRPMAYFSIENPLSCRSRSLCFSKNFPRSAEAKCLESVIKISFHEDTDLIQPPCQLINYPNFC